MIWTSPHPPLSTRVRTLPDSLADAAARAPDRPAIVEDGELTTFAALQRRIERRAREVAPDEVIAIQMPNCVDWAATAFGALHAGGVVTGIGPGATDGDVARQLDMAGATRLVTAAGTEVVAPGRPAPGLALLPCSSGTTGLPKAVMLTHDNLAAGVAQVQAGVRFTERDVVLGVAPFAHVMGFVAALAAPLAAGATVVTVPRFDLRALTTAVHRPRVTVLIVPPPVAAALTLTEAPLDSVELVVCGGAALSPALQARLAARLPQAAIAQGYGMTETTLPIPIPDRRTGTPPGATGRLAPSTELRVGEEGELCVRGPQVTSGYYRRPDATAELIDADGWLHTGDLGFVDDDGQVHVVDRLKELIKVNALQVAPAELEALLTTHPSVEDAAVVARPHEKTGEVPIAFVVARGDLDPDDVLTWVAERVAPHKRVAAVIETAAIPRTPSGKILRRRLREAVPTG
jgi:acyl-CoA synthetase (AMP-forming)/AMP-acid ligase II